MAETLRTCLAGKGYAEEVISLLEGNIKKGRF